MKGEVRDTLSRRVDTVGEIAVNRPLLTFRDEDRVEHIVREMIKHHQDAVEMSELVSDRAEHAELKDLAKNIIKDQTREIQQMKEWQKEW